VDKEASISRGSLGGQNSPGRRSGARSSRALSTIFRKLRNLDREIAAVSRIIATDGRLGMMTPKEWMAKVDRLRMLDEQRKAVRNARKGYEAPTK